MRGRVKTRKELSLATRKILLGNEAIAHGILESHCTVATSYPGTPASEVLRTLIRLREEHGLDLHLEWSVNEKVAFEVALANSYVGRRSAVVMKQVGLNVAADPLMSAAYTGVKGGFVLVVADDPGPHSSQTEQDSRFFAMMAKVPVFDPSSPAEARELICKAFELSEKYEIPVMLRPTTRVCHAREDMEISAVSPEAPFPLFEKNPARWAATPKFRLELHRVLNEKIHRLLEETDRPPRLVNEDSLPSQPDPHSRRKESRSCLVASGTALAHLCEVLRDLDLWDKVPLYQVLMPYPLSSAFRETLLERYERILVLEETYPVMELQFQDAAKVHGRRNGVVPSQGELLPETVEKILREFLGLPAPREIQVPSIPGRRPTLCAGCPHRATFFAIKKAFPKGIYPGDIGCYTLGLNLGVVDTVLCMGASVSQATGLYFAHRSGRKDAPVICATIGDSGPGQRSGSGCPVCPGDHGQRHHGHDGPPAHPGVGQDPGRQNGAQGFHSGTRSSLRGRVRGRGRPLPVQAPGGSAQTGGKTRSEFPGVRGRGDRSAALPHGPGPKRRLGALRHPGEREMQGVPLLRQAV